MPSPLPPGVDDVSTAAGWFHYWAVTILAVVVPIGGVLWWLMRLVYHLGTRLSTNESMTAANNAALEKLEPRVTRLETALPDLPRRAEVQSFRDEMAKRFDSLTALVVTLIKRGGEGREE